MKDDDDKSMDNFMRHLAACEILTKTAMIEYANENPSDERERVTLITSASLGIAAAALHSMTNVVADSGNANVGVKTLALYQDTVQMELLRMINAIHKAGEGKSK